MTSTTDNFETVPYHYMWDGELVEGSLTIAKAMLAGDSNLKVRVREEVAGEFKKIDKVVVYGGCQLTGAWGARHYNKSAGVKINVTGPFESFDMEVYDAGEPIKLMVHQA